MDSVSIPRTLRQKVATAANHRCEYCHTAQEISGAQMQIDHIIPQSVGGTSDESNLCLACAWCNSYKWSHTAGFDAQTNQEVPLFNPRQQQWHEHFLWSDEGTHILGITPIGRATIATLQMNNEFIIPARRNWVDAGWHPPKL